MQFHIVTSAVGSIEMFLFTLSMWWSMTKQSTRMNTKIQHTRDILHSTALPSQPPAYKSTFCLYCKLAPFPTIPQWVIHQNFNSVSKQTADPGQLKPEGVDRRDVCGPTGQLAVILCMLQRMVNCTSCTPVIPHGVMGCRCRPRLT